MSNKIKAILGSIYLIILTTFLYLIFSEFDVDRINDFSYYKELRINIEQLIGQNLYLNLIIFFTFSMIWLVLLGFGSPILILSGIIFGKWIETFISLPNFYWSYVYILLVNIFLRPNSSTLKKFNKFIERFQNEFYYFL